MFLTCCLNWATFIHWSRNLILHLHFSVEQTIPLLQARISKLVCLSSSLEFNAGNTISATISGSAFCSSCPSEWFSFWMLWARCQAQDTYSRHLFYVSLAQIEQSGDKKTHWWDKEDLRPPEVSGTCLGTDPLKVPASLKDSWATRCQGLFLSPTIAALL